MNSQNWIFRIKAYFCKKNKIFYQMHLWVFVKNFRGGIFPKINEKIPPDFPQIPSFRNTHFVENFSQTDLWVRRKIHSSFLNNFPLNFMNVFSSEYRVLVITVHLNLKFSIVCVNFEAWQFLIQTAYSNMTFECTIGYIKVI